MWNTDIAMNPSNIPLSQFAKYMSTEQPESAHSQGETQATHSQGEITQQATSPTPTAKPAKPAKNPKRVVAGKLVAERRRQVREAQKKAAAEADVIIANNGRKPPPRSMRAAPATEDESPSRSSLSTTQWLAAGSFVISLIGLYYKREELKAVFSKKTAAPQPAPEQQPAHATPPPQPKDIRLMD